METHRRNLISTFYVVLFAFCLTGQVFATEEKKSSAGVQVPHENLDAFLQAERNKLLQQSRWTAALKRTKALSNHTIIEEQLKAGNVLFEPRAVRLDVTIDNLIFEELFTKRKSDFCILSSGFIEKKQPGFTGWLTKRSTNIRLGCDYFFALLLHYSREKNLSVKKRWEYVTNFSDNIIGSDARILQDSFIQKCNHEGYVWCKKNLIKRTILDGNTFTTALFADYDFNWYVIQCLAEEDREKTLDDILWRELFDRPVSNVKINVASLARPGFFDYCFYLFEHKRISEGVLSSSNAVDVLLGHFIKKINTASVDENEAKKATNMVRQRWTKAMCHKCTREKKDAYLTEVLMYSIGVDWYKCESALAEEKDEKEANEATEKVDAFDRMFFFQIVDSPNLTITMDVLLRNYHSLFFLGHQYYLSPTEKLIQYLVKVLKDCKPALFDYTQEAWQEKEYERVVTSFLAKMQGKNAVALKLLFLQALYEENVEQGKMCVNTCPTTVPWLVSFLNKHTPFFLLLTKYHWAYDACWLCHLFADAYGCNGIAKFFGAKMKAYKNSPVPNANYTYNIAQREKWLLAQQTCLGEERFSVCWYLGLFFGFLLFVTIRPSFEDHVVKKISAQFDRFVLGLANFVFIAKVRLVDEV